MKKGIVFIIGIFALATMFVLPPGCANIIPPTGGPRDSLPPRLVQATPVDSSVNFTGNRIVFSFNEYVDVQNIQENLIVSPTAKIEPVVEFKLRTVTVRIKDTLEPATTYSLNFGNAIRDINEGNELKNFTYVFSTGSVIDQNELSGKVIIAETGKTDSTLIAILHRSGDDSAVVKERPRYYAKLDSSGNYRFRFLPAGTFYLYALKDEGGTRRYLDTSQVFAFASKPVVVTEKTIADTLYAYAQAVTDEKKSVGAPSPLTSREKTQDKRLIFQTNLDNNQQDLLSNFQLSFSTPLKVFDTAKVIFADYKFQPFTGYRFTPDSTNKVFSLVHTWIPDSTYNIILEKDFAEDSTGKQLIRKDTLTFKAKKETDYGSLRLRFPNLDLGRNPVLQLVQSDKIVFTQPLDARIFNARLFKPGDYSIRILYDDNRNGKWDPGSFFGEKLQPEKVFSVIKPTKVKANWDNDDTFTL